VAGGNNYSRRALPHGVGLVTLYKLSGLYSVHSVLIWNGTPYIPPSSTYLRHLSCELHRTESSFGRWSRNSLWFTIATIISR